MRRIGGHIGTKSPRGYSGPYTGLQTLQAFRTRFPVRARGAEAKLRRKWSTIPKSAPAPIRQEHFISQGVTLTRPVRLDHGARAIW
jgi:hypothetical protein